MRDKSLIMAFAAVASGALYVLSAEPVEEVAAGVPRDPERVRIDLEIAEKRLELLKAGASADEVRAAVAEVVQRNTAAIAELEAEEAARRNAVLESMPEPVDPGNPPVRGQLSAVEFLKVAGGYRAGLAAYVWRGAGTSEELEVARRNIAGIRGSAAFAAFEGEERAAKTELGDREAGLRSVDETGPVEVAEGGSVETAGERAEREIAEAIEQTKVQPLAAGEEWRDRIHAIKPYIEERREILREQAREHPTTALERTVHELQLELSSPAGQ